MPAIPTAAVAILGPTASGKSSLALKLATEFNGEIVSCDALQVYKLMDIGTAKPTPSERETIPHHLLDLREPGEDFSAGDYQRAGREALCRIRENGRLPIVAGGTGFYFRALLDGLFEGPGRSEELRTRMRAIADRGGTQRLYLALVKADPESAKKIAPADRSRILRAYEVHLSTGRPISWWRQQPASPLEGFRWLKLALDWPRDLLYSRINSRVEQMFEMGFVDEVRDLREIFPPNCHAFKAIGYRQIVHYLEGKWTRKEALANTQQESRRYAKRQLTWFRSMPDLHWLPVSPSWAEVEAMATAELRNFLSSSEGEFPRENSGD
jgi:tRNA dimethylallyltransferase